MPIKQADYLKRQLIFFICSIVIAILSGCSMLNWGLGYTSGASLWYIFVPILIIQFLLLLMTWDENFPKIGFIITSILFGIMIPIGGMCLWFQITAWVVQLYS